jgi:serine phosphatase RsbU (regulator of sigma subunit)
MSRQTIPPKMFITCLIVEIDLASGEMIFANAGHNLPFLRSSKGITELRAVGMPLGLLPDMTYEEKVARLGGGDSLLLYSDGLVEVHNPQKEMYGLPRLRSRLAENRGGEELIHHLLEDLAEFTGEGWEQEDDMTCLVLKRLLNE